FPGATVGGSPLLTADQAVEKAAAFVGEWTWTPPPVVAQESGPAARTTFENTMATRHREPEPILAEMVTFPMTAEESARLGWKVTLETNSGHYEVVVDDRTGALLSRTSTAAHAPEGLV